MPGNAVETVKHVSDLRDTARRIAAVGRLLDLNDESTLVRFADILLAPGRHRLSAARQEVKRELTDWVGNEIDDWWGALLALRRIQGIDDTGDNMGADAVYIDRIQKFMRAANTGVSLESIRLAAEAGSGVAFRATENEGRVLLVPFDELTPFQRASVYETVRKIAPARTSFEIGDHETYAPLLPVEFRSDSFYVGEPPSQLGLSGPTWDSPNYLTGAFSNKWSRSHPGDWEQTDGIASNIVTGGVWHTGPLGAGTTAILHFNSMTQNVTNFVYFYISPGTWGVSLRSNTGVEITRDVIYSDGWVRWEHKHTLDFRSDYQLWVTNLAPDSVPLYMRNLYMGAKVAAEDRERWVELGQETGKGQPDDVVAARPDGINRGFTWISEMQPGPNAQVRLWFELSGVPIRLTSLVFATETPGVTFTAEISNQETVLREVSEWSPLPGVYKMVNGRVKIKKCRTRFVRLTFTGLKPAILKNWNPIADG